MQAINFCYWLQGFFELNSFNGKNLEISIEQAAIIQCHLNLVFKHEIDPDVFKNKTKEEIAEYIAIHSGAKRGDKIISKDDFEKILKKIEEDKKLDKKDSSILDEVKTDSIITTQFNC